MNTVLCKGIKVIEKEVLCCVVLVLCFVVLALCYGTGASITVYLESLTHLLIKGRFSPACLDQPYDKAHSLNKLSSTSVTSQEVSLSQNPEGRVWHHNFLQKKKYLN